MEIMTLADDVETLLWQAFPDLTEEERLQVRLDIQTLCQVVLKQKELLQPLLVLKRALEKDRADRAITIYQAV